MESAGLSDVLLPTLLIAALALMAVAALQRGRKDTGRADRPISPAIPKPRERARGQQFAEAHAAQPGRDDFLANIAHELRTPLVAMLGYVELLSDTQLDRHQRNYADGIAAAGSNLLDIVDDLTNLSRIESGRLTIHEQSFSVHDCVDSVTQMLALSAYNKGLDFIRIVDPDVPATVQGDPLRLRQVLVNLITNAVKFTRSGSVRIHVTVATTDTAHTTLEFAIADTGIGLAAQDLQKIFQPFARIRRAMVTQGTGLGLVITQRLCEAMHGTIAVTSTPSQGSRFAVRIPFRADADPSGAMTLPPQLTGRRILLSCNDPELADWLSDCLSRHGAHSTRMSHETVAGGTNPAAHDLALVFVGTDLLSSPDRLAAFGAALRDRTGVLSLVSTSSGHGLQRVERMLGGEALPAHAPIASICARVAELTGAGANRAAVSPSQPSADGALAGLRLLVAEDNTVSRDYLRIMLSRHGADVEVCSDGNQAVQLVGRQEFDVVLMDSRMPDCDGPTATRRIRTAGFSLPVIGLTAAGAECQNAMAAGMTNCLVKPLDTDELLKTIASVCRSESGTGTFQRDFLDAEMLSSLNTELPAHAQRLTSAVAHDDRAAMFEEAHKLNGIASLCGFEALRRQASELEDCLRADLPCDISPRARTVLDELSALCDRLRLTAAGES